MFPVSLREDAAPGNIESGRVFNYECRGHNSALLQFHFEQFIVDIKIRALNNKNTALELEKCYNVPILTFHCLTNCNSSVHNKAAKMKEQYVNEAR